MFAAVGESEAEAERSDGSRGAELRLRVCKVLRLCISREIGRLCLCEAAASCNFSVGAFSGGMSAIAATPKGVALVSSGKDSQKTWPMSIH
jgi:hypothetical protein